MEIYVPEWLEKFAEANESPLYLVGGYVRNMLGGLPPSDVDVAGNIMPEKLVLPRGFFFATTYRRMGTALIKHRFRPNIEMEYTPFRTEEYAPGGGHTPISVRFNAKLEEDARRRDFTVNSIYYDIKSKRIIDFFGGREDIAKRLIRAYDPEQVFASDGLRLMRLVRIAAETGFGIERATAETAMRRAAFLSDITPNRKRDELIKILNADLAYGVEDAHYRGLKLLRDFGFLPYILPELAELDGLAQPCNYHKYDALEHTFRVVRESPPEIRLAALLHDIGKAEAVKRNGRMHNHEIYGAEIARRIMGADGLRLPNKVVQKTERLVRWHMYDGDGKTGKGKMLLFAAHNSDIIDELVALMEADRAGKGVPSDAPPVRLKNFYEKLVESGAPVNLNKMKINGADLLSLGYEGTRVKEKLSELFDMCVLSPELNKHKKLMKLAEKDENKKPLLTAESGEKKNSS